MSDEEMPKEFWKEFASEDAVTEGTFSLWDFERSTEIGSANGEFENKFLVSNAKRTRKGQKSLWDFEGTNRKGFCKPSLEFMYI